MPAPHSRSGARPGASVPEGENPYPMNNFIFETRTKVVFGTGCVKEYLSSFLEPYGPHVLLAYGSGSIKRSGLYDAVCRILWKAGKQVTDFSNILPGPTYAKVQEGAELARSSGADLILAVGGGSVLDCAKAVSMAAVYPGDLWTDFWAHRGVVDFAPIPLGGILTAPGGSGMNGRAVLNHETLRVKCGRDYPRCDPVFTLIDPSYTRSLPASHMISAGFDTLCHLMECYFSQPDTENVSDDLAEALMRGTIRDLRAMARTPESYDARSNLMWESALSGNRLLKLGKRADFPCHRLARQLEAATGCPHDLCLAVLLPACYRRVCQRRAVKFSRFAQRVWEISAGDKSTCELAQAGAEALSAFVAELGLPTSFQAPGLTDWSLLEETAAACAIPPGGSLPLEPGELPELFRACWAGERKDRI